jgi:fatty acid desaturase
MSQQNPELRAYAKKQLKKQQEFRVYLWVFAAVVALTTTVWFLTSPGDYFWPIWVIFGMGIGAVFSGLDAFGKMGNKPITDADIDAEVERLGRKG